MKKYVKSSESNFQIFGFSIFNSVHTLFYYVKVSKIVLPISSKYMKKFSYSVLCGPLNFGAHKLIVRNILCTEEI